MRNKSFLKMMGRSIKGSLSRFVAIVGITALGAGFLAGLMATSPDMKDSSNAYFDKVNLYDFYVQSTLGFSDDDIDAIEKEPYIKQVMAIEQEDHFVKDDEGESLETRIFHLDFDDENLLNKLELVKGNFPKNNKECVVEVPNKYSYETDIGRKYTDEDGKEYTVSGIVNSPLFISTMGEPTTIGKGSVGLAMYVKEAKKPDVYTAVYAISNIKDRDTFSEEYKDKIGKLQDKFEVFGESQVAKRHKEIVDEANKELNKNKRKFNKEKKDAYDKINDGERKLKDNQKKLDDGLVKVNDGLSQVENGLSQIEAGQVQISSGKTKINDGLKKINGGLNQINGGLNKIQPGINQVKGAISQLKQQLAVTPAEHQEPIKQQIVALEQKLAGLESQKSQLNTQKKQLLAQKKELLSKKKQLVAQEKNLANKKANLIATRTDLYNKRVEIRDGKAKLKDGWKELRENKAKADKEFAKAEKKIKDAEKDIADIEEGEWFIASRLDSTGVSGYLSDIDKIKAIANIFPVFFFIVAALVVLTTMTRMIEEERGQVGTLKSLGYDNRLLRQYYLFYGAVATIIGSLGGLCAGFIILPKVISNAYGMLYNLPATDTPFRLGLGVAIMVVTIIFVTLTILYSCRNELKEKPASLLQPKAPEAGKRILLERIPIIWNRLKFTRKITLRNLFRYKKRFLMTIIGVAGCFALLLTGFGIRDSIGDIVELQFGQVTKYDVSVALKDGNLDKKQNLYDEIGMFATDNITLKNGDKSDVATLTVPEDIESMKKFVELRNRTSKDEFELKDGDLLLSEKVTEICDVKKGDKITIEREGYDDVEMEIAGFFEYYVGNVAYMTRGTYENIYGQQPEFKTAYMNIKDSQLKDKDMDDVIREIMEEDNVKFAMATDTIRDNFNDSVKNIDYIVWVLIICAGALSVIVLYNLTNINICERKKELATIKVLGFFDNEVRGYIFREVYLLSGIGVIAGIPLGLLLHRYVIRTAEVGGMMFGRNIYLSSFILSIVITFAFTVLVSFIMRRSIRKINMVESMKATD